MRKFVVVFATVALLLQAGTALANNQWGTNHWAASTSGTVSMTVSDNGFNPDATSAMLAKWSFGNPLAPNFLGEGKGGQIVVTTGRSMLWLGLAQIWVDGSGHITKGQVKINTTLLARYNGAATTHVLCQELGHIFGLDHDHSNTGCMDDLNGLENPLYQYPSSHDIDMLNAIYNHIDDTGVDGGGGGGSNCPPKKPGCSARSSGHWVTIHTFWAPNHP